MFPRGRTLSACALAGLLLLDPRSAGAFPDGVPATFPKAGTPRYERGEQAVWLEGKEMGADAGSFAILDPVLGYARDGTRVFYGFTPVEGADPETFRVVARACVWTEDASALPDAPAPWYAFRVQGLPGAWRSWAMDGGRVYFDGAWLAGADPATFRVLDAVAGYAGDGQRIWFLGKPVAGADPGTFGPLRGASYAPLFWRDMGTALSYARDRRRVFLNGEEIPGADPASFAVLSARDGHAKDRRRVYYRREMLEGVDPLTARIVVPGCVADARRAFFRGIPFENGDAARLEPVPGGEAPQEKAERQEGSELPLTWDGRAIYMGPQKLAGAAGTPRLIMLPPRSGTYTPYRHRFLLNGDRVYLGRTFTNLRASFGSGEAPSFPLSVYTEIPGLKPETLITYLDAFPAQDLFTDKAPFPVPDIHFFHYAYAVYSRSTDFLVAEAQGKLIFGGVGDMSGIEKGGGPHRTPATVFGRTERVLSLLRLAESNPDGWRHNDFEGLVPVAGPDVLCLPLFR